MVRHDTHSRRARAPPRRRLGAADGAAGFRSRIRKRASGRQVERAQRRRRHPGARHRCRNADVAPPDGTLPSAHGHRRRDHPRAQPCWLPICRAAARMGRAHIDGHPFGESAMDNATGVAVRSRWHDSLHRRYQMSARPAHPPIQRRGTAWWDRALRRMDAAARSMVMNINSTGRWRIRLTASLRPAFERVTPPGSRSAPWARPTCRLANSDRATRRPRHSAFG